MTFYTWIRVPRGYCHHLAITEPRRPNGWTTVLCGLSVDTNRPGVRLRMMPPARSRQCDRCRKLLDDQAPRA